jgi:hypothetical protein
MPTQACLSALLVLVLLPGTTSLPPMAVHLAPRLTLRGGIDIKWTPSSDEPIAPFSKKARDAQAEAEGRNPSAQPPEPWSIPRGLRAIGNAGTPPASQPLGASPGKPSPSTNRTCFAACAIYPR